MVSEQKPVIDYERKRRDLEQLKASKAELTGVISRQIDWLLDMEAGGMLRTADDMAAEPFGIVEASARARQPLGYDPAIDHEGKAAPEQVGWYALGHLIEHEPEKGRDVWQAIKQAARHELATGVRAADALEPSLGGTPWRRAQYLAIVDALNEDLQPRGALEGLMVQRMASTYSLCLKWQELAIQRQEMEEWEGASTIRKEHARMSPSEQERHRMHYGYLPPRLSQAEAIQEAALMADRYDRAFLRLVRAFRDYRRMFASLIAEGGTVNVSDGPQQVNIDARSNAKPRGKKRADRGTSISDNRR